MGREVKRGPGRPPGSGKKQMGKRGRPPGSTNKVTGTGNGSGDLVTLTLKVLEFQSELFSVRSQVNNVAQQLSTAIGNMNTNSKILMDRIIALEQFVAGNKPTPAPVQAAPTPGSVPAHELGARRDNSGQAPQAAA